ncbi:MAG: exo-alpha-sialidase [Acidobacteria bacterium]|nr:exo-alpha-sialidase [Acidobacteriota bacterium]MBV9147734.1 exo-alpha-sialidase [Acidobacteriota bacterium]MBV9436210.1 exo-alpha-sialidase [Acidobacteriota bacterium]
MWSQTLEDLKSPDTGEGLSSGAEMAHFGPAAGDTAGGNPQPGYHDHGRGGNTFVNDPCLDPPPPSRARTVQSETEIAAFGKYLVLGYNDSYGFYDNTQGLSGYSYSVNGGNTWIDGSGLPPLVKSHSFFTDPTSDHYFGDPVLVVDQSARTFVLADGTTVNQPAGTFYYSSLYSPPGNPAPGAIGTVAVNRGQFQTAPPQNIESVSNTRCVNDPSQQGVPDTKNLPSERIVWEPPVVAVTAGVVGNQASDFLDKEWLAINQANGELYLSYVRFGTDGSTPLEMVRSKDGGRTWTPPSVIVPNLNDTFNTGTQPTITGTGRIVVTYLARTFAANGSGPESDNRIEVAISDDDGNTFSSPIVVEHVNAQGEPNGYNRGRRSILNAPYITPQAHGTDVYITYFNGKTPFQQGNGFYTGPLGKQADIILASSHDNGTTWTPVKVNDDDGLTSHVFSSAQVNKNNWVFVGWTDRRVDPTFNEFTDEWAAVSHDGGATFGHNVEQTDVSTTWRARADAAPNFGDYNSSELLNDNQFMMSWADARFPPGTYIPPTCNPKPAPGQQCPPRLSVTPDTMFTIANGLGTGK